MFNIPLTEDEQQTLAWMDEVCKQAFTEARAGNLSLINSLGKHSALSYYINNVVSRNVMTRDQFAVQYRGSLLKEAAMVYQEYRDREQMRESAQKTSQLEESLGELRALVEQQANQLKEQANEIAALREGKKPSGKKIDKADPEADVESEA